MIRTAIISAFVLSVGVSAVAGEALLPGHPHGDPLRLEWNCLEPHMTLGLWGLAQGLVWQ